MQLDGWYTQLEKLPADHSLGADFWAQVMGVKDAVNKQLEAKRNAGEVGGSLEAEVTLFCANDLLSTLSALQDELRFVLITSKAIIKPLAEAQNAEATDLDGLQLSIVKSTAA